MRPRDRPSTTTSTSGGTVTTNTTDDVRSRVSENCFVSPATTLTVSSAGLYPRRVALTVYSPAASGTGPDAAAVGSPFSSSCASGGLTASTSEPTTAAFTFSKSATTLGDIWPDNAYEGSMVEQRAEVVLGLYWIVEAEQRPCAHAIRAHQRRARLRLLWNHRLERDDGAREERDRMLVVELVEQPLALCQIRVPPRGCLRTAKHGAACGHGAHGNDQQQAPSGGSSHASLSIDPARSH